MKEHPHRHRFSLAFLVLSGAVLLAKSQLRADDECALITALGCLSPVDFELLNS